MKKSVRTRVLLPTPPRSAQYAASPHSSTNRRLPRNGRKSLGPKSDRTKRRSALNAVKQGALDTTLLLPGENAADLQSFTTCLVNRFFPHNEVELGLVDIMIASQRRLRRAWTYEQTAMIKQSAAAPSGPHEQDANLVRTPNGDWELPAGRATQAIKPKSPHPVPKSLKYFVFPLNHLHGPHPEITSYALDNETGHMRIRHSHTNRQNYAETKTPPTVSAHSADLCSRTRRNSKHSSNPRSD